MRGGLRQNVLSAALPSQPCSGRRIDLQGMLQLDHTSRAARNLFQWLTEWRVVVAAIPCVCQHLHQCPSGMFASLSSGKQN